MTYHPTATDIANRNAWEALLLNHYQNAPTPVAPATLPGSASPTAPAKPVSYPHAAPGAIAGTSVPSSSGFVQLTGLPKGNYWGDMGCYFQVAEVTNTLTGDQHGKALANLNYANAEYKITDFIGLGRNTALVDGQWQIAPGDLAGTITLPAATLKGYDLGTVNGATEWYTQLAPPSDPHQHGPLV